RRTPTQHPTVEIAPTDPAWDIVEPEPEVAAILSSLVADASEIPDDAHSPTDPMIDRASLPTSDQRIARRDATPPERRYARLFTRLQQRRAATAADATNWPLRLWR